jgi:hypothetical protein
VALVSWQGRLQILGSAVDTISKDVARGAMGESRQPRNGAPLGGILVKGSLSLEEQGFVSALADLVMADLLRSRKERPS